MRFSLLGAAVLLVLGACSSEVSTSSVADHNVLINTGFEDMMGWVPATASLTKERAHSGQYAVKVDKDIEYSLTYRGLIGEVLPGKSRKLRLTGWVNNASPAANAVLTLQVLNLKSGATVFNEGVKIKEQVKTTDKWEQVSREFSLPESVAPTDEMRVFLWRADGDGPVYLDDLELHLQE